MLEINPSYQADFARLGWDSFAALSKHFLREATPSRTTVRVQRGEAVLSNGQCLDLFYKQYDYVPPSWKFLGRASKARCEVRNYAVFAGLGIPCAQPVAWGEEFDRLGRLRRALIITRAIAGARTLVEFWRELTKVEVGPGWAIRRKLGQQLAAMTRRLHDAQFHHRDLVWRNILVTAEEPTEPKLWWIDCPRGGTSWWPWPQQRQRVKDLASLDKSAVQCCTRAERLGFVKAYLQRSRLDAETKALAKAVLRYRRRRWPDTAGH